MAQYWSKLRIRDFRVDVACHSAFVRTVRSLDWTSQILAKKNQFLWPHFACHKEIFAIKNMKD